MFVIVIFFASAIIMYRSLFRAPRWLSTRARKNDGPNWRVLLSRNVSYTKRNKVFLLPSSQDGRAVSSCVCVCVRVFAVIKGIRVSAGINYPRQTSKDAHTEAIRN